MRLIEYWQTVYNTSKLYRKVWWEIANEYPIEMLISFTLTILLCFGCLTGLEFLKLKIRKYKQK